MPLALAWAMRSATFANVLLACAYSATPEIGSPQTAHLAALGSTSSPQKGHLSPPGPAKPWKVSSTSPRTRPFLTACAFDLLQPEVVQPDLAGAEQVDIEQVVVAGLVKLLRELELPPAIGAAGRSVIISLPFGSKDTTSPRSYSPGLRLIART